MEKGATYGGIQSTKTHEFASQALTEELRDAAREDYLAICHED